MRYVVIATRVEPFPEGLRIFGPYTFIERATEVADQINTALGTEGWLASAEHLIGGYEKAVEDFLATNNRSTPEGSK